MTRRKPPTVLLGALAVVGAMSACGGRKAHEATKPNAPPEVSELQVSPERVRHGLPLKLSATASDPDGDPLTYHWQIDGETLDGTGPSASWNPPSDLAPLHEVTASVRVSDGPHTIVRQRVVRVNHAPQLTVAWPDSVAPGAHVTFHANTSDPDGDPVAVSWTTSCGTLAGADGNDSSLDFPKGCEPFIVCTATDGVDPVSSMERLVIR